MLPVECLWDFYLSFPSVVLLFQTLNYTHFMAVITFLSYFNLHALPFFFFLLQSVSSFLFLSCIGLHEFKWTSLALQAQSGVDKVWFHPLSSPLCVCVCVCADAGLRTVCTSCDFYLDVGTCWASPAHQSMSPLQVGLVSNLAHFTFVPHLLFEPILLPQSPCPNSFPPLSIFLIPSLCSQR